MLFAFMSACLCACGGWYMYACCVSAGMLVESAHATNVLVSMCYFSGDVLEQNPAVKSSHEKVLPNDKRETIKQRRDSYARTLVGSCLFLLEHKPKWIVKVYHDGSGEAWVTDRIGFLPNTEMCRVPDNFPAEAMVLSRFLPFGSAAYRHCNILVVDCDLALTKRHLKMYDVWKTSCKMYAAASYGEVGLVEGVQWLACFVCANTSRDVVACGKSLHKFVNDPCNLTRFHRDELWLAAVLGVDASNVYSDPAEGFKVPLGSASKRARSNLANAVEVAHRKYVTTASKKDSKLQVISNMCGYEESSSLYAILFVGDSPMHLRWLHADEMIGVSTGWLEMARAFGLPKKHDHIQGRYQYLKRGVLTRSQSSHSVADASVGITDTVVPFQSSDESMCTSLAYLNMTLDVLSKEQVELVLSTERSASVLSALLSTHDYPVRMGAAREFTGVPKDAGLYMVSSNQVHCDGVRVFADGSVMCFPSDSNLSKFVLSSNHVYVKKLMMGKYEVVRLCNAGRPQIVETIQDKRRRLKHEKRKRQKVCT
jgi:hypothetical protein